MKRKSRGGGDRGELAYCVFVRILGANRLARSELEGLASDRNCLGTATDQLHLHATEMAIVTSLMEKLIDVKIRIELAVHPV